MQSLNEKFTQLELQLCETLREFSQAVTHITELERRLTNCVEDLRRSQASEQDLIALRASDAAVIGQLQLRLEQSERRADEAERRAANACMGQNA